MDYRDRCNCHAAQSGNRLCMVRVQEGAHCEPWMDRDPDPDDLCPVHRPHRPVLRVRRDHPGQEGAPVHRYPGRDTVRRRDHTGRLCRSYRKPLAPLPGLRRDRSHRQRLRLHHPHRHPGAMVPRQARPGHRPGGHGFRHGRVLHGQDRTGEHRQHGRGQHVLHVGRHLPGPGDAFRPVLQESPGRLAACRVLPGSGRRCERR